MEARYTYEQLVEKIVRAKVKIEGAKASHRDTCPVEYDPEGLTPCNCGATLTNVRLDEALRALDVNA